MEWKGNHIHRSIFTHCAESLNVEVLGEQEISYISLHLILAVRSEVDHSGEKHATQINKMSRKYKNNKSCHAKFNLLLNKFEH